MRDAILPWAVMAVTVIVAVGLLTFFRHLLKLREQLAPEVVYGKTTATETAPAATAPAHRDLAA